MTKAKTVYILFYFYTWYLYKINS